MNTKHPKFTDVAAMLTAGVAGITAIAFRGGDWLAMTLIALMTLLTIGMTVDKKRIVIFEKSEHPNEPNEQ